MKLIDKKIFHLQFGEGQIENVWDGDITIRFADNSNRTFHFVDEFDQIYFRADNLKKQFLDGEIKRLQNDRKNIETNSNLFLHARTHADFINQVFSKKQGNLHGCTWDYSAEIVVWMVSFSGENSGFQNRFLDENTIRQRYVGNEKRNYYFEEKYPHTYRLVVSVNKSDSADRIYRIEGLFRIVHEKCTSRDVFFERISNEQSHKLMPMLF